MYNNIVAIVGRPNVGKSTFFNRMLGERQAIVDDVSGVTRDRQYGISEWNGKRFAVVDTGGFIGDSEDVFAAAIREQVKIAIEESQVVVFIVDVTTGVTDLDMQVAALLRKSTKPVFLVINKVDNHERLMESYEFYSMGFEKTFAVSSITGSGTGELLDEVVKTLPEEEVKELDLPKIAIVGQPNAGKSSLVNVLLGEERNIVTDIAGTTRDSIHTHYNKFGKEFILIDTAGLRRKKNVKENLEFYSVMRAIRSLEESDICIILIDAVMGIESQDLNIFRLAIRNHKGIVLAINKWDLIEKTDKTALEMEEKIRERIAPFTDVPILFISVTEKQRIFKVMEVALEVQENRQRKISTSKLNDFLEEALQDYTPPAVRGKLIKIKYMIQIPTPHPSFVFFCNHPKHVPESYRNYLENRLRKKFNFSGTPISLFFREK